MTGVPPRPEHPGGVALVSRLDPAAAALSEGLCAECGGELQQLPSSAGRRLYRCTACRLAWGILMSTGRLGSWRSDSTLFGVPEWMTR